MKLKKLHSIFSQEEHDLIKDTIKHYESARAASIEVLKLVQKNHGWVSDDAIEEIAKLLNISNVDIEEIATFYSQIFRKPIGRNVILYCDSVVCYINCYFHIQKKLEEILNIKTGQTTSDGRFTLLPICCLGCCDKAPVMMINHNTYFNLKTENIKLLLEKYQ